MPHNDDRISLPRRLPACDVDFGPLRNTTLVLSIGVARFGRAYFKVVLLKLCLGDMLATARKGGQDHADVLHVNRQCLEYTVADRVDPPQKEKNKLHLARHAGSIPFASLGG